jgi:hypothetical protein
MPSDRDFWMTGGLVMCVFRNPCGLVWRGYDGREEFITIMCTGGRFERGGSCPASAAVTHLDVVRLSSRQTSSLLGWSIRWITHASFPCGSVCLSRRSSTAAFPRRSMSAASRETITISSVHWETGALAGAFYYYGGPARGFLVACHRHDGRRQRCRASPR